MPRYPMIVGTTGAAGALAAAATLFAAPLEGQQAPAAPPGYSDAQGKQVASPGVTVP